MACFLVFITCQSDLKEEVGYIRNQYKSLIEASCDDLQSIVQKAESLKKNIQLFQLDFPGTRYASEMDGYLVSVDNDLLDILQRCLSQQVSDLDNSRFNSYTEAIEIYDDKIELIETLKNSYQLVANSDAMKNILVELKTRRSSLEQENRYYHVLTGNYQRSYSLSDADMEISEINEFLKQFPSSIMKVNLVSRIDTLNFTRFQLISDQPVSSVLELNGILSECENIREKISIPAYQDFISQRMEEIEGRRAEVFEAELEKAEEELFDLMLNKAKNYSDDHVHDICQNVVSGFMEEENKREYVGRTIYQNMFHLQTKGGFACQSLYKTIIKVSGELSGDPQSGVSGEVTGVELVSDREID
jgi:hypothetical protein